MKAAILGWTRALALGAAGWMGLLGIAGAQSFPAKPVSIVVPFAAGGAADTAARLLAQQMNLGQPIIVENRGGAGGTIGAAAVAKAAPDGHTLLFVTAGHAGSGALYPKLPFDPDKDFAPVTSIASGAIVIVVNAGSAFRSLNDLVAAAKANPDKLNCAGGGGGATVTNLALESLKSELNLKITSVPYKGSAPAITALLGGEIDCNSDNLAAVLPQVKAGKLRALAVTTRSRSPVLPDIPTVAETVLPTFDASIWFGIMVPRGTPQAIVDRLNREFGTALGSPKIQERFRELGLEPQASTPAVFGSFVDAETRRWSAVIKALNLKPE